MKAALILVLCGFQPVSPQLPPNPGFAPGANAHPPVPAPPVRFEQLPITGQPELIKPNNRTAGQVRPQPLPDPVGGTQSAQPLRPSQTPAGSAFPAHAVSPQSGLPQSACCNSGQCCNSCMSCCQSYPSCCQSCQPVCRTSGGCCWLSRCCLCSCCDPCTRKRWKAKCCGTPGDMYPETPYCAVNHGNYYFRPYHYSNVARHQAIAARWGADPRAPYRSDLFYALYAELGIWPPVADDEPAYIPPSQRRPSDHFKPIR